MNWMTSSIDRMANAPLKKSVASVDLMHFYSNNFRI
jgi:hypothetical protein